jgi:glycosyltransferase involved in cell wall biosynthesis
MSGTLNLMADPISLLLFSNSIARGGAEEHILTLLRRLDRRLFQLHLVCTADCAEKLGTDIPSDVSVTELSLQKPYHAGSARRFSDVLRRKKVDILHSHLFGASFAAAPIGWICGIPAIIETPHIREAWRHGPIKGNFAIDRLAGRFVDSYIAVSRANARYLVQEKGLPESKVRVIQNGSDLTKFSPKHFAPPGMKQSLGFAADDPVLLVVGRLDPQKGHGVLLEAMKIVLAKFPATRLVCIGDGELRGSLERRTSELGLSANVRFVGFQSNVRDWLAMAEISVLPSFYEGLPLAAIESLAAARPMVATAVDGTVEVVVNEQTGLTVPPGDPAALADAILRLLRDDSLRTRLGEAGQRWVFERFNEDRQISETETLYVEILSKKRPRTRVIIESAGGSQTTRAV